MKKNSSGFTLIELLVTMAIIAVLAGFALFASQGVREQGRDAKRKSDLESIRSGLEIYKSDCSSYPSAAGSAATVLDNTPGSAVALRGTGSPSSCATTSTYISNVPVDPQDTNRLYYYSSAGSTYILCAQLESAPSPAVSVAGCGNNCGTVGGGTCNWRVISP